jgi:hypothetical protein
MVRTFHEFTGSPNCVFTAPMLIDGEIVSRIAETAKNDLSNLKDTVSEGARRVRKLLNLRNECNSLILRTPAAHKLRQRLVQRSV